MGVAVRSRTSGAAPLPISAARCSTPKRCCSSITTSPSRRNATPSCSSAWVPTTSRASPPARRLRTPAFSAAVCRPRSNSGFESSGASSASSVARMLLRQQLGRRHERRLIVVLQRQQHGEERNHRLTGADVAHEEPVHPLGSSHVGGDLPEGPLLVFGQLPGQALLEPGSEVPLDGERHAAPMPLGHGAGPDEHQLEIEQLVERQPPPALLGIIQRCGAMHRPQGVCQRRAVPGPAAGPREERPGTRRSARQDAARSASV